MTAPDPMALDPNAPDTVAPHCIICGYDLAGLAREGVCPECGTPVEQSYQPDLLENRSPAYLTQLRSGLSFVLNGILAWVVLIVLGISASIFAVSWAAAPIALVGIGVSLAIMLGWWKLTTPDPGKPDAAADLTSRRIIRAAVAVQLAVSVLDLASQVPGTVTTPGPGQNAANSLLLVAFLVVGVLSIVAWVAQFFAAMVYLRWLARRVPDEKLHRRAKRFMWLGPLLYTVGLLLLGLGPLIALVMYWNMLNEMRKHMRRMLAAA